MKTLESLREELVIRPNGIYSTTVFFYLGLREHYDDKPILAKAHGTANLFRLVPAYIYESDLIAGSIRGAFTDTYDERIRMKADSDYRSFGYTHFYTNADHFAPNYRRFLKDGVSGTLNRVKESMKRHKTEQEQRFLKATEITLNGFKDMLLAYNKSALLRAEEANDVLEKAKFTRMAEDLKWLTSNPPSNFRQALQLVFLTYVAFVLEGRNAMALGRMDQYLYLYYSADREKGNITPEEATELLSSVFLKIGEHRYLGGDDTVNICIGGVTPDGKEGVNELSYCILEAVKLAKIPGPNLSARLHEDMPKEFLDECLKVIATGIGYPALMNDEVNIPALLRHGYDEKDVNDYCFVGCIENFITGKQPSWFDGRFNVPMYFEPVFFHGKTLLNKEYIGLDTGDVKDLKTMDDFISAFHKQLVYGMKQYYANFNNENDRYNNENYSQPFLSVFCDDCIDRAKDIRDGGAVYPSAHGVGAMGIATVADCLAAIEMYVYNEKKYTLLQVSEAILNNYEGYEEMQQDFLNAPKYGNDDDFVDKYAVWFVKEMDELIKPYHTRDGGPLYIGIASNIQNISAGKEVGATTDGRNAGEALSDAASPMHGMDHEGITAVVNSTTKPNYKLVSCGTVLNQKFTPKMLNDDESRSKVCDLIRVYFKKGGQEIQINSVSRDILKDAMKHPENYQSLVVRVSGFSAFYTNLDRSVQLDILKRTEHDDQKEVF